MARGRKRIRIYSLYQRLFRYESKSTPSQRQAFAKAVQVTGKIIGMVWEKRSTSPITEYMEQPRTLSRAKDFLKNYLSLIGNTNGQWTDWSCVDAEISLDGRLFPGNKIESLAISFQYVFNSAEREIIVSTYGRPKDMAGELGALATLVTMGTMEPSLPPFPSKVTYWDLVNGEAKTLAVSSFAAIAPGAIVEACAALMSKEN